MASFNVSTEDSTPLITYSPAGAWLDSPIGDPFNQSYSAQSWHVTNVTNAAATFAFNGTGVWFYGANRPDYGTYNFIIDGAAGQVQSAAAATDAFGQLLGGADGLAPGEHTAVLVCVGSGSIDLDSIVWQTDIGLHGAQLSNDTIAADDQSLEYGPPGSWVGGSTLRFTQIGGATVSYNFSGDAIGIWGVTSSGHGNYSVSIDDKTTTYNGASALQSASFHKDSALFFASDIGPGNHTLVFTANPDQEVNSKTGKFAGLSRIAVFSATGGDRSGGTSSTTQNPTASTTLVLQGPAATSGSPSPTNVTNTSNIMTGTQSLSTSPARYNLIIGTVAGAVGVFLILFTVMLLFIKRRRSAQSKEFEPPSSPRSFVQKRPMSEAFGLLRRPSKPLSVFFRGATAFLRPDAESQMPRPVQKPLTLSLESGARSNKAPAPPLLRIQTELPPSSPQLSVTSSEHAFLMPRTAPEPPGRAGRRGVR